MQILTSLPLPYHNKRSPAHSGDELPFLGDELQNRGRAPASAGAGRQYKSGSPLPSPPADRCKQRLLRRGTASAGRAAGCRSRSRRPYALHCRAGVHARRGGLRRGTPLFYVSAAPQGRGGVRQTGRVLARSCAAPLSRLTPTAPLTGEPSGRQSPQSLPCKGRWMRRKAQTEGGIAALRQKYPARPGRALPCLRRGRCLHRPGNPAVAQGPRGGRNRPPYIAAINRCQPANTSHPSGPPAGR